MQNKSYLFEFDYGKRMSYRPFLIELMDEFDKNSLTGITFFINNNPYNLEFLLLLVFEKEDEKFDKWLKNNFPKYSYKFLFNYTLEELINNQFGQGRYNAYSFSNEKQMDTVLSKNKTQMFLYPDKKVMEELWGGSRTNKNFEVFLSHSSLDKNLMDEIFSELQKSDIKVWYDKYEIDFGDSITDKINDGLNKTDLGLICISKNFLSSNWAKSELNFFLQKRINSGNDNFIVLNLDCEHNSLPPLIQDYRYLNFLNNEWKNELINSIEKKEIKKAHNTVYKT